MTTTLENDLKESNYRVSHDEIHNDTILYTQLCQNGWYASWPETLEIINRWQLTSDIQIALVPGEERPTFAEAELHGSEMEEIIASAEQIWLIDALEDNRLMCQFMPVVNKHGRIFGYESLVRAKHRDGSIATGGAIFNASRILRIQHLIDRYLHQLAIRQFVAQNLPGLLFINLLPGFIQRPEFYFGNLNEACLSSGMDNKRIVLECMHSENPRDIEHLKAIFKFCREKGYLCSLDDIESLESLMRILKEMKPDFIKLDMRLVHKLPDPLALQTINDIIAFTRTFPSTLIAEGIENQQVQDVLDKAGIPLFQGYLYSPPAHCTEETSAA